MLPNKYSNKIKANAMPYRADDNYFNQNIVHPNASQMIVCNERSVREFLDDYCVNTINLIIQEMQFFLNMTTCKTTKKHLFTRQNRGENKMQGIIDISYRQINTLALQIVIPLGKLSEPQNKIVLHWMYDECDKLCNQFQFHRLDRSDLFFEMLLQNCEEELKEREANQSRPAKSRKAISNTYSYQSNQQQMDSNDFAVPPPPYTSPSSSYGAFQQHSYQSQTYFVAPMAPPPQQAQSHFSANGTRMASSPNVRSQQINTVTQSQELQRPMTAPVQSTTTHNPTNPYDSYNQQAVPQNRTFGTVDVNHATLSNGENIANPHFQQMFCENNTNIGSQSDGQQSMLNANGFTAMPIQRQTIEGFNTSSNSVQLHHKRAAPTFFGESSASKLPRNALVQNDQQQPQYVMRYGDVLDDGLRTPIINMSIEPFEITDFLSFNAAGSANNNENIHVQMNDASNELSTPPKTKDRQSLRNDANINNELQLFNEEQMFGLETSLNIGESMEYEIQPAEVTIVSTNAEQQDTVQPVDTPAELMPSMPDLFDEQTPEASVEQNAKKSIPETEDEPSNEKSPKKPEEMNTREPSPKSSDEIDTLDPTENTSIDSARQLTPEIASKEPCISKLASEAHEQLTPEAHELPTSEAHEQPAVESGRGLNNNPNIRDETSNDGDCEILVETNTQLQPKIKKEEPLDDSCDSENITGFVDLPSSMRKCNRYVDLTVDDDDDCDSDVVVVESDEEEPREQKFNKYQCVVCSQLAKLICVGCYCRTYCSDFCKDTDDVVHTRTCSKIDVKDILRNQE